MTLLLSFLSRYGLHLLAFALIAGVGLWGYNTVYNRGYAEAESEYKEVLLLRDQADRDAQRAAEAAAQRAEMLMAQIAIDQALINAQKARKREIQYVEVTKWRTKYEKNPNAGKCVVPDEFVRVLDATGQDSGSVSGAPTSGAVADGDAGRVSDIELLQYATDAKMMCLRWRDKLIAWQKREGALQTLGRPVGAVIE